MKKLIITSLSIFLCFLTGCKDIPDTIRPELEVAVGESSLIISAEGGPQEILYSITNPVEGGVIEAVVSEGWINGFNYDTENKIIFNAEPNLSRTEAPESRGQLLTVTYTYGAEVVKQEINVIQEGERDFDHEYEMPVFRGVWNGNNEGLYPSQNYRIWISDAGWNDDKVKAGGLYYQFDMYGIEPEDEGVPAVPAGTYILGGMMSREEWTFDEMFSVAFRYNDSGQAEYEVAFKEGTVTVSYENGEMCIDAVLTDTQGLFHHVTYKGEGICIDARPQKPGLHRDIDVEPTGASSEYVVHYEEQYMELSLVFEHLVMNGDEPDYPFTQLRISANMAFDKYGFLQTGTYAVGTNEIPSVTRGGKLMGLLFGTCIQHIEAEDEYYYDYISDGSMVVSGGWGTYTINCDFTTSDGHKVTCDWSGALNTIGMPGNTSTLEEDYTLNLKDARLTGFCWGDFRENNVVTGKNWYIKFEPGNGGDSFMVDFVSGLCNPDDGFPTGTYTAAESQDLAPWRYMKGAVVDRQLLGTAYMGNFNEDGRPTSYAPAVSGDMNITNNGDGTYHIWFEFLDDKGNTWDGDWSGPLYEGLSAPERTNYVELPAERLSDADKVRTFNAMLPLQYRK